MRRRGRLVLGAGTPEEQSFPFQDQIAIGRRRPLDGTSQMVLLRDPSSPVGIVF